MVLYDITVINEEFRTLDFKQGLTKEELISYLNELNEVGKITINIVTYYK